MKVLVTDHVFADLEIERAILEPLECELVLAEGTAEVDLVEAAQEIDGMLVCYANVTAAVIAAAADAGCRIISRYGVGYDNIDVDAATERGVLVTYVPDYCLAEVADHTMALLLSLARGVHQASLAVRDGEWAVPHGTVHRLQGRRLALLGVGGIGRLVLKRARAFGLEVIAFDPYVKEWDLDAKRAETLEEAVAEADFISLHVPLTDETRHVIGKSSIEAMRRAPIVVNTARGPLVDMDAAVDALRSGRLSGIALDVTEIEPPPVDHPLRGDPRAVLTPHMGFYSVEAQIELQRRAAAEVARALRNEPPDRPVNPEAVTARNTA